MKRELFKLTVGRTPFMTVEEMRHRGRAGGDGRMSGSMTPSVVEPHCKKELALLEIGPEDGTFTKWLKEHGYRDIHTLDFLNSSSVKEGITAREIDFNTENFPYADNYFGSSIAWGVIEHLENPHHFLREVHRTLKDRGTFIAAIPNILHLKARLHFLVHGFFQRYNDRDNHVALFPHGVFEKTFLRYFDLEKVVYTKQSWNLYATEASAWLPANVWFGNYVVYILKKKKFVPYS